MFSQARKNLCSQIKLYCYLYLNVYYFKKLNLKTLRKIWDRYWFRHVFSRLWKVCHMWPKTYIPLHHRPCVIIALHLSPTGLGIGLVNRHLRLITNRALKDWHKYICRLSLPPGRHSCAYRYLDTVIFYKSTDISCIVGSQNTLYFYLLIYIYIYM